MFRKFHKTFALAVVVLVALVAPMAFSAPAYADPIHCTDYLRSITGSEPTAQMQRACNQVFDNGAAGTSTCASLLRAEGIASAGVFEACRRAAPANCPLYGITIFIEATPDGQIFMANGELIRATASTCTARGELWKRSSAGLELLATGVVRTTLRG